MSIPFVHEEPVAHGEVETLSPLVRRVTADNPSPFTFRGTGTFIVGTGEVAVIDAGPALDSHVDAILAATSGETVTHQFVTHTHLDHSPASRLLGQATGAGIWAFGPPLRADGRLDDDAVEEGFDRDFRADHVLDDGDVVAGAGWTFEAVHTPGHMSNHMCYALREENTLFSGDHVMGWSSTVISPPDGDMAAYMKSLRRLLGRKESVYRPTHGAAIGEPAAFLRALIAHREAREARILACLESGLATIPEIVEVVYAGLDVPLRAAARRSVLAHMIKLVDDGGVACDGAPTERGAFRAIGRQ